MSIEHSLIPAGEQHVVANWQVGTVPDLDNITVTFDDIGKQAWVQGIGHFTLANSDPITWEAVGVSIASFTYTAGTKLLTITDSAGDTYTATIDGLTTAEVAALITAHAGAVDPHGDRAYSVQRANHTGTQLAATISDFASAAVAAVPVPVTSVFGRTGAVAAQSGDYNAAQVGAQPSDTTLTALAAFNTNGILVQTAADTFAGRSFADSSDITWTNPAGTAGNPSAALAVQSGVAGSVGSASAIPVLTFNSKGVCTGYTTATVATGIPDWAASTVYALNKPVMYQGQQFICTTAHTSTGSFDYIQFSPISGVLDVAIASGTFTPYANANIKSYNIRATGSFTMNLALAATSVFAQVVNVTTSGVSLTITSSQILAEGHVGAATGTPITLSVGEGISAYNLNNNGTTYFQRINSYKQPAALATFYKSGSQTVGATFDASALTAAKTMTLPNGDVWLNELPHLYAISSGTIAWKTGLQTLKPSFIFASGSFTIDLDLVPTVGVVPFTIINVSTATITITLSAYYGISGANSNTGSPISLLSGETVTCTNYDSGALTFYFRKQGAFSSSAHVLYDNTTPSKRLVHAISAIAASTTRTVTWPNADVNMGKVTGHLTAVSNLTVGASPFTYQNTAVYQEDILITGGTVSLVEFTRDNVTWYARTGDTVSLSPSDRVRVTYTVAPTMTKIPR